MLGRLFAGVNHTCLTIEQSPLSQAGAIRAQLKQQKRLKLRVQKRIGKHTPIAKKPRLQMLLNTRPKSKGIYPAKMLAQHACLERGDRHHVRFTRNNGITEGFHPKMESCSVKRTAPETSKITAYALG